MKYNYTHFFLKRKPSKFLFLIIITKSLFLIENILIFTIVGRCLQIKVLKLRQLEILKNRKQLENSRLIPSKVFK